MRRLLCWYASELSEQGIVLHETAQSAEYHNPDPLRRLLENEGEASETVYTLLVSMIIRGTTSPLFVFQLGDQVATASAT